MKKTEVVSTKIEIEALKKDKDDELLIRLREEDFVDTEKSSLDDSIGNSEEENAPGPSSINAMQIVTNEEHDEDEFMEEYNHKRKRAKHEEKDDDDEIIALLQQDYMLSEQRMCEGAMQHIQHQQFQRKETDWPFYPVVNQYYPYNYVPYGENFSFPMMPVNLPYYNQPQTHVPPPTVACNQFCLPKFN